MHIRPKTKRRLLILSAIMGSAIGLLLIVYGFSRHRSTLALRALRSEAMTAYRSGNYEKSVTLLQEYLDKASDPDPDAQFAFGKSRINVPLPAGKHLYEGIRTFKQYLDTMKPGDSAAEHELLKLYVQASCNVEAEHLADEMLAKNPTDGDVLWQKVWALVGEHHPDQALALCLKLNEVEPLNLPAQLETIELMGLTNAPADQQIAHAQALHKAHDQDPRFEVLMADAYAQAKQDDEKKKWLQIAASRTPPDAQFVLAMVSSLDNAELFTDAADFLARAADAIPDPFVQRLYAQRLWQNGKLNDLETRLKSQDPASRTSDGMLLGYRALALFADGKTADGQALVKALAQRSDAPANAWAIGLSAKYGAATPSPNERVTKYQQAVSRDPQNPVLRLLLAEGYLQTGEGELAIQQCDQAFQFARSWAMPHIIAVQALLAGGRNGDAVATAREAWKRAPGRFDTETTLARAEFALACESGLAADFTAMLPRLELIQRTWHDSQMLAIYVTALARSGKADEAVSVVKAAIAADPPLPASVLANLAQVAETEQLKIDGEVLDFAQKLYGLSPEIAYARARDLLEQGKQPEGFQLLVDASKGHENELSWRIVIADFREMSDSPDALKDWIALGDQYTGDLPVQQTILHAQSRMSDRAFWSRTIDRVKGLTGDQAIFWRIERGRWLLAGDLSERDQAEAINLLTQVTHVAPGLAEPHRLLAFAMQKAGNVPAAIIELTAAADANQGDPVITRALVELLVAKSRSRDAQTYLDKLAQRPRLADDVRQWLVNMYLEQGANDKAVALMANATGPSADPVQHDLMLAALYRRVGRDEQAAPLYLALIDKPINEAASCVEGADFFAGRHDMATADKFMAKLAVLPLEPGELEVNRAEFCERWIGVGEAFKHFQAAILAAPKSVAVWGRLAGFHMRHERFADAAAAAENGLKAVPDNAPLKALRAAAATLASLDRGQDLQALVDALVRNPDDAGATELLRTLAAAQADKLSPTATAGKIRAVADRHPQNIPLQSQAVRSYLFAGQTSPALEMAQAMATANPNSPEPQRLLADIYATMGQWGRAEQAALLWREHSMGHSIGADMGLAEIYLRQPKKDPAGAVRVLGSHISPDAPLQNPLATELYARALVLADRAHEAADLLKPLTVDSPHWRKVWLDLAVSQKDGSAAVEWIAQVAPSVPADAQKESLDLANTWYMVGVQLESPPAFENAGRIIQPLLDSGTEIPQAWMLGGQIAHAKGDYVGAEKSYRQLLKLDPHSVDAMNNLAYVLWLAGRDEDLAEARRLSESAVAGRPTDASFYDTLARIQARAGDRKGAIQSFQTAMQKDPASLEAMIGLADLLAQDPATRAGARDLLTQIQRLMDTRPKLSTVLRKQYQTARDAVASSI